MTPVHRKQSGHFVSVADPDFIRRGASSLFASSGHGHKREIYLDVVLFLSPSELEISGIAKKAAELMDIKKGDGINLVPQVVIEGEGKIL